MKCSIRKKILLLNLSGLLLCALCIGGIGIYCASDFINNDETEHLNLQCEKNAVNINATLSSIEQYVKTLSYVSLAGINSLDDIKQANTRDSLTQVDLNFIHATIRNVSGAIAVYVRYNPKIAPPTSGIFMTRNSRKGEIKEEVPTDFSKYNPDDVEHVGWYYIPTNEGKPLWMSPYENKNIDVYMISYVVPLFRVNDEIGVVGVDIDFNYLISQITRISYKSGFAYLEDENGKIVYHPILAMGETAPEAVDKKIVRQPLINGMRLVLVVSNEEFNKSRTTLTRQLISFTLIFLALFAFLSHLVARGIIRPLSELTKAANQMTSGNLNVSFNTSASDEIGDLSRSFDSARKYIKEYLGYVKGIAYKDSLTGVKNKAAYDNFVNEINLKIKSGDIKEIGAVALDVNRLKQINDTYGHDHGNMLLINASKIICQTFDHSPVFRTGGDEFVVILMHEDYDHRDYLMKGLQECMARTETMDSAPWERVSIAAGLSTLASGDEFKDIVNRADAAMYKNKKDMKMCRE